jgi:penicillin-binding protein 1A
VKLFKSPKTLLAVILIPAVTAFLGLAALYLYLEPQLPSIEGLSDVRLQVPLRIYSSDGSLLGEFGEKRRSPKSLDQIPLLMRQAFLSAEDDRFYHHPGVDYQGIIRAALNLIKTGERGQGGSTITMQLARNFYLSSEKTYLRKINEIFLALKIEHELTKDKILELYLNKIYLGNRAYGVAAAAHVYYGKPLDQLSLAQIAMIAGLPKAPSAYNPIVNPERALVRRNYVLSRMHSLHYISDEDYARTTAEPVTAQRHSNQIEVKAPYIIEMVRSEIVSQFGDEAYNRGLRVYTTIKKDLQKAANDSLWDGLVNYDRRHGFRGVIKHIDLDPQDQIDAARAKTLLEDNKDYSRFQPAIVVATQEKDDAVAQEPYAEAVLKTGEHIRLQWSGLKWASPYINVNHKGPTPKTVAEIVRRGDVIWVVQNKKQEWVLGQIPQVQGALVSVAPNDGAIRALIGGFDFAHSKFNRAVQAKRQPGSGFKPIIYSAALANGFTPASIINDAPVVFDDPALEASWRPENYSGKFFGPTRLREALVHSRNLVSIRLLRAVGISKTIRFAKNFGFEENELPHDLSLALGSCELSPLELARAYSVIDNGGYLIKPYFIQRIEDSDGSVLYEADPAVACTTCVLAQKQTTQPTAVDVEDETIGKLPKQAARTLDSRIAYLMNSMMKDVIRRGTGVRAMQLGRHDLAGKTGTTNDQRDAWFNGFNQELVAVAWVGFDQIKPLGSHETGSHAALPIWVDFMREALRGVPEKQMPRPDGLVNVKINATTGEAATDTDTNTMFEVFRTENAPKPAGGTSPVVTPPVNGDATPTPEQLF